MLTATCSTLCRLQGCRGQRPSHRSHRSLRSLRSLPSLALSSQPSRYEQVKVEALPTNKRCIPFSPTPHYHHSTSLEQLDCLSPAAPLQLNNCRPANTTTSPVPTNKPPDTTTLYLLPLLLLLKPQDHHHHEGQHHHLRHHHRALHPLSTDRIRHLLGTDECKRRWFQCERRLDDD